ncbi:ribosomal-processing cysteine protease Prp [Salisediminibacterium halotolerans]|uniref:Ribosomal processing cysteine protease Prp n=1 Tax=Salisediminibacterium halotolerans TaxID=517425 RepID=A0A1H9R2B1_9BACI|nr:MULTISPECIES: ribosomal-processing cysteine protease Prp [Salisediminibacterium]RLJ78214.1 hypothetical protein BCL39_0685 [Actinophytocola xinjiangensis]RPE88447.1 hypothetical protein EDD67_0774 [Salisediminibacterium halotolerans]TWG37191.1 hypothetical protein BCL52_0684 [Salisediminibacterium halotolerans]SER66747.1 hypothetical protein SAMN05444126_1042 [Salisediminibacterium haloalkalitolerans]GEL07125.1 hypothetical protein SHA02_05410 [Salisediminibacterium halotolerans]
MISFEVNRRADGAIEAFTMSGHADSGPYGYDIVCAGASAVSFGAVNAIAELAGIYLETDMQDEGGYLHCRVPEISDHDTEEKVQWLLEGMIVSMKSIEANYRQFLRMESN